jgi:hypothetical protein
MPPQPRWLKKLDCPTCGHVTETLQLVYNYEFLGENRQLMGTDWKLGCDHILADTYMGQPILQWSSEWIHTPVNGVYYRQCQILDGAEVVLSWVDSYTSEQYNNYHDFYNTDDEDD